MATPPADAVLRAASPVVDAGEGRPAPTSGVALCLSGGGYRAMLFHAGALVRLNELGWLPRLTRVSSVSGGSITAGVLATRWDQLEFDGSGSASSLRRLVLDPLHALADQTIDVGAIVRGALGRGSIGMRVAAAYRKQLFGRVTLQELPVTPRFVFNATSLQSGVLRRFSRPYAWDYRVGKIAEPRIELGVAVAASSAFPPFLSPLVLELPHESHVPGTGDDDDGDLENLEKPPYTTRLVLTDGGVYDNLGLETAWKGQRTILISDGGGRLCSNPRPRALWPLQLYRVLSVIDGQVRAQRKRQAIECVQRWSARGRLLGDPHQHRAVRAGGRPERAVRSDDRAGEDQDTARTDAAGEPGAPRQLGVRRLRRWAAKARRGGARPHRIPVPGRRRRLTPLRRCCRLHP